MGKSPNMSLVSSPWGKMRNRVAGIDAGLGQGYITVLSECSYEKGKVVEKVFGQSGVYRDNGS